VVECAAARQLVERLPPIRFAVGEDHPLDDRSALPKNMSRWHRPMPRALNARRSPLVGDPRWRRRRGGETCPPTTAAVRTAGDVGFAASATLILRADLLASTMTLASFNRRRGRRRR
jgi:hypothetical protein